MNRLQKLLSKLKRSPPEKVTKPLTDEQSEGLRRAIKAASTPVPPAKANKPKGRVIKQAHSTEFNPDPARRGGRVVKVMPRQLQKIKAAQEMVENDGEQPKLEDLEG